MRAYRIDDLTPEDEGKLHEFLNSLALGAGIAGMYWLPVPPALLSPVQQEHVAQCGPYVMALELEDGTLALEFLVRARGRLRCECVHYASAELQAHMMRYVDSLFEQLLIPV